MRMLIPIEEDRGKASSVSEHFGHCRNFAIFDDQAEDEAKKLTVVRNDIDHSNSESTPADQIMRHDIDFIFAKGMGGRAIRLFSEKGVMLRTGPFGTVGEVIGNIGELKELEQDCGH